MSIDKFTPQTGRYMDENGNPRNVVELITGGFKEINSDHDLIHKGIGFCMHLYHSSLAHSSNKVYRFKGPDTKFAHIKNIVVSSQGAPISVELIKDVTITNVGTEITDAIQNLNHNSEEEPESKVFEGAAAYSGGEVWCNTVIHGDTGGAGANTTASSGSFVQSDYLEYITKDDEEEYIIKVTNLSGSDAALHTNINMFFYEEPLGRST